VATTEGGYEAEAVIVAVPAAALPGLLRLRDGVEDLAATPYSTGLLVGMAINRPLRPDELADAYGVLMHPDERPLAAMCVASRAGHAVPGLDLVTCLFTDADARRLSASSDTEIVAAARRSLLAWAPSLGSALRDEEHRLFRIPAAMPRSAPGRLASIEAYRRLAPGRRVVLAGDSLAWPWSDSAAFAGEWAADRVLELVVPD